MKHINILLFALSAMMLILVGCSDVNNITNPDEINHLIANDNESGASFRFTESKVITDVPLIAGKELIVGTVSLMTNKHDLYVTYHTTNGWLLRETNLHVLQDLKRIPLTKDNVPDLEQFAYRTMHYLVNDKINQGITEYTYKIPLENTNIKMMKDIVIVANAVLVNEKAPLDLAQFEMGWGGMAKGPGPGNWRYIQYTVESDNPGGERPDAGIDVFSYDDKAIQ